MSVTVVVNNRLPMARAVVHAKVSAATRAAAFQVEAGAKGRAAVDTGAMRNAINAHGNDTEWRVDSPAEYSVFLEYGTSRMAARPFMVPALHAVMPVYLAALRNLA